MTKWTEEWPTEPGKYWFWGQKFRNWSGEYKPGMYLVKVRQCVNSLVYVTDGHFIYEEEGARGQWQPAVVPEPPPSVGDK